MNSNNDEFKIPSGYRWKHDENDILIRSFASRLLLADRSHNISYGPGLDSDTSFVYDNDELFGVMYANTVFHVEKDDSDE